MKTHGARTMSAKGWTRMAQPCPQRKQRHFARHLLHNPAHARPVTSCAAVIGYVVPAMRALLAFEAWEPTLKGFEKKASRTSEPCHPRSMSLEQVIVTPFRRHRVLWPRAFVLAGWIVAVVWHVLGIAWMPLRVSLWTLVIGDGARAERGHLG